MDLPQIVWSPVRRRHRLPGETGTMTGVRLTDAGWALVTAAKGLAGDHGAVLCKLFLVKLRRNSTI
jgi:hypothetical protein